MRSTSQVQPTPEPEQGQAEDDLEIPSFLRRLAN
jgi:cell division protein FtsZ